MSTFDILESVRQKARVDADFREKLLATRAAKEPVSEFCRICRESGFMLYEMELIALGEEEYAAMKRSTNGGGENSPVLEGQDDYYEMLMTEMEMENRGNIIMWSTKAS